MRMRPRAVNWGMFVVGMAIVWTSTHSLTAMLGAWVTAKIALDKAMVLLAEEE